MDSQGTTPRDGPPSPSQHPCTILVVDDEPDICESLKSLLEYELGDARVLTASSGPEALELMRKEPVDLIIADYRMPGMDGLAFLHEAKRLAPDVPRFICTAHPDLELAVHAINEVGIQRFVRKPIALSIAKDVRSTLHERHGTQCGKTGATS